MPLQLKGFWALVFVALLAGRASAQFPTSGLVDHWRFDEAANVARVGTKGVYTMANNGSVGSTTGKFGNATDHVAADVDYLSATIAETNAATALTISIWAKRAAGTDMLLWGPSALANFRFNVNCFTDNRIYIAVNKDAANLCTVTLDPNPTTNGQWSLYVVRYDASQATNATKLKLDINGVSRTVSFVGNVPSSLATNANQGAFLVGREVPFNRNSTGQYDELAIWDRALSDAETAALWNSGNGAPFPGLVPILLQLSDLKLNSQRSHYAEYGVYALCP